MERHLPTVSDEILRDFLEICRNNLKINVFKLNVRYKVKLSRCCREFDVKLI